MTTARQISVISKTPNGWCSVEMDVASATPPWPWHYEVRKFRWRVQTVECHGQTHTVADDSHVPMWFDDHGDAQSHIARCVLCGTEYAVTFRETTGT